VSLSFISAPTLLAGGPYRFAVLIERLLLHIGFDDIRNIDGAGDAGGDILAALNRQRFVFQCKWTTQPVIDRSGINDLERAKARYMADRAVLVTNTSPNKDALNRQRALAGVGVNIEIWNGTQLARLGEEVPRYIPDAIRLRPYQASAIAALTRDLRENGRALLILATGLGKTIVGGELIRAHLDQHPADSILVVAHMKELVQQLEKAIWRHLPKDVDTNLLTGESKPASLRGVTCATIESALAAVYDGFNPGLIMVDETHHVSESGAFQKLLDIMPSAKQFGVTATPWRGDQYDITHRFGLASFTMGIAEGMHQGYLAQVDYRLYVDDIDWEIVERVSEHGYSLKELNEKLFLPQRDEAIVDHLVEAWSTIRDPRAIVFCQTIEHAQRVAQLLARSSPNWSRAASIHSRQTRRDRELLLSDFRLGRVPIITARDIFNEGVDVPDVNIICFLRVTHSRRIFVQQLGRGLRLRQGKDRVLVLDFATDIRRIAATLDLKRKLGALRAESETLALPAPSRITFSDEAVGTLMDAWIQDAADLETAADEVKLQFPFVPMGIE
jgi:superfamily II DNA or RNA helicase